MKATTLVASFALAAVANAWKLDFYGVGSKYVKTHGTRDVDCNNLISDYNVKTDLIDFNQATDHWKDPSTFTAYQYADCEGPSWTGNPGRHTIDPPRRFRSYSLH
ncbi:hypothetical protein NCS52_01505400 [Fusarium sp. LHS14.1]|nr:hypothetical protein NCS52_01505400 [Fusarium sp. LHS14.1]